MSLKLLAEQLLLGCPLKGIPGTLFIPGELQRQRLALSRRIVVYISPHNPGALAVAKDIVSAMNGQVQVTSDATEGGVTHFLLYLNEHTYLNAAGETLADEIRVAMAAGVAIVTVHENDEERGGCEFSVFFDGRTPRDLLQSGIYNVCACCLLFPPPPRLLTFDCSGPYTHAYLHAFRTGARGGALLGAVLAGLGRAGGQGDGRNSRRLVFAQEGPLLARQHLHDSLGTAHRRTSRQAWQFSAASLKYILGSGRPPCTRHRQNHRRRS